MQRWLQVTAAVEGGADAALFLGSKLTKELVGRFEFGDHFYEFKLAPTVDNRLIFTHERWKTSSIFAVPPGNSESALKVEPEGASIFQVMSNIAVYHSDDVSMFAKAKLPRAINDNEFLRADAENLPAYLYRLQTTNPDSYRRIREVVRLAAPFFDDFKLRPMPGTPDMIQLEWTQVGTDFPFRANQLSDGTLRFICLATALLQAEKPATILIDEPELGLHPYALSLIGALLHQAAASGTQCIVSTQSAALLNEFTPEDIIVVERLKGESTFHRLDSLSLSEWLEDYSLGDLWQKNVIGARPTDDRFAMPSTKQ